MSLQFYLYYIVANTVCVWSFFNSMSLLYVEYACGIFRSFHRSSQRKIIEDIWMNWLWILVNGLGIVIHCGRPACAAWPPTATRAPKNEVSSGSPQTYKSNANVYIKYKCGEFVFLIHRLRWPKYGHLRIASEVNIDSLLCPVILWF